jgi:hypothetical protein
MRRTTDVGNFSTLKCMHAFLEAGYLISLLFGDGCPYDLSEHLTQGLLRLRVSPTANNQTKGIRWAQDFEIHTLTY